MSRPPRRRMAWLTLACLVSAAPALAARAAESPLTPSPPRSVVVSPPACPSDIFPTAPFLDGLRVELAGRGLSCCTAAAPGDAVPAGPAVSIRIDLPSCAAGADTVQVSVRDGATGRTADSQVSLGDVAQPARPRALALAAAELLRSLQEPNADEREARVAPTPVPPPRPVQPAPAPRTVTLRVEANTRATTGPETRAWGGRAGVSAERRGLHVDLDAGGSYGRTAVALGTVVLETATAAVGFGPRFMTGPVALELGLRAELGWAWVHGESTAPDVLTSAGSRLISSMGLRGTVAVPARRRLHPYLGLEAGWMTRALPAQVNGETAAGLTGLYWVVALGMAASP